MALGMTDDAQIVSPFDHSGDPQQDNNSPGTAVATAEGGAEDYLELTWENVDKVLDEMRPYLIQDGGNVVIADIDGPVVKLQLEVCIVCVCYCSMLAFLVDCWLVLCGVLWRFNCTT